MYHKIAWMIVTKLQNVNTELVKKESQEICAYGIEITLSMIVNYVLLFAIGFVFKSIISAVIFGIVFTTIRHYIGGYRKAAGQVSICGTYRFAEYLFQYYF